VPDTYRDDLLAVATQILCLRLTPTERATVKLVADAILDADMVIRGVDRHCGQTPATPPAPAAHFTPAGGIVLLDQEDAE